MATIMERRSWPAMPPPVSRSRGGGRICRRAALARPRADPRRLAEARLYRRRAGGRLARHAVRQGGAPGDVLLASSRDAHRRRQQRGGQRQGRPGVRSGRVRRCHVPRRPLFRRRRDRQDLRRGDRGEAAAGRCQQSDRAPRRRGLRQTNQRNGWPGPGGGEILPGSQTGPRLQRHRIRQARRRLREERRQDRRADRRRRQGGGRSSLGADRRDRLRTGPGRRARDGQIPGARHAARRRTFAGRIEAASRDAEILKPVVRTTRPTEGGLAYRVLSRVMTIEPAEAQVVLWCWLYIFAVMSSYYIMRPLRDQMGVAGGVNNLQWLFTGTLLGILALNLPFAYLVKTLPRSRFIPLAYRFFAANIILFAIALLAAGPEQTVWVGRVFFIWLSVYNLFVVSIFWQMNVDLFSPEQGKRLFGFIAAGATLGAVIGSAAPATVA